jgi:hypothetical protein
MTNARTVEGLVEFLPGYRDAVANNSIEKDSAIAREKTQWFGFVCHAYKGLPEGEEFGIHQETVDLLKSAMIDQFNLLNDVDYNRGHFGRQAAKISDEQRRAKIVEQLDLAISQLSPAPSIAASGMAMG